MNVEGVSATQNRMAEIQARMAQLRGVSFATGATGNGETTTAVAGTRLADQAFTDSLAQASAARTANLGSGTITTLPAYTGSTVGGMGGVGGLGGLGTAGTAGALAGTGGPTGTAGVTGVAGAPGLAGTSGVAGAPVTAGDAVDLSPIGIPPELAAYGNGRIPASALSPVGGSSHHMLWTPAARAYEQMSAAAARAGVSMGITDSYRSYPEQVDLARRKGLHSQGGLAARPGTSDHGWGKSVDLRLDASAQAWIRAHGAEFGFSENVSREPWHWTYRAD